MKKGGVESGFNKVKPEEYKPRLFQLKGKTKGNCKWLIISIVACYQVPLSGESLNQGDVFVLDGGLQVIVWTGSKSRPNEKVCYFFLYNHTYIVLCQCFCRKLAKSTW